MRVDSLVENLLVQPKLDSSSISLFCLHIRYKIYLSESKTF